MTNVLADEEKTENDRAEIVLWKFRFSGTA